MFDDQMIEMDNFVQPSFAEKDAIGWVFDEGNEEFIKAEIELKRERTNWLRNKILYSTIYNVVEDARVSGTSTGDYTPYSVAANALAVSESQNCNIPQCSPSQRTEPSEANKQDGNSVVLASMERKLKETCESLLEYHDHIKSFQAAKPKVKIARTFQLGEILQDERKNLEVCRRRICDLSKAEKDAYASLLERLLDLSKIMCDLLTKYKTETEPKRTDETFENLLARCSALRLKMQTMILKLKNEVYSPDNVIALQAIRTELSKVKRLREQEIASIEQQLHVFSSLGDDFNSIVSEYNQFQSIIEKQTWCLEKLNV